MPHTHKFQPCGIPDYELCSECGTYHSLSPADPKALYDGSYWDGVAHSTLRDQAYNTGEHLENGITKNGMVLAALDEHLPVGQAPMESALEIGCAPGNLLGQLKNRIGFGRVDGIETDISYKDAIKDIANADVNVHFGFFPEFTANWVANDFAAVIALDLFEHVLDPVKFLAGCHRLLKPGGILILMTPIVSESEPMPDRAFNAKEHVWIHSKKHLEILLDDAGFGRCLRDHNKDGDCDWHPNGCPKQPAVYSQWTAGHDLVVAKKV